MTYEEAREFINLSSKYGSVLGLETITELLLRLGNPQDKLKIVHVAGTNGKGSTTAFIASILSAQGYSVGKYNSPAVFTYHEMIQISRRKDKESNKPFLIVTEYITKEGIADTISMIQPICEILVNDGFAHPTSFEIETAMAFLYFLREKVDFAVIEVGLGGRLDASNNEEAVRKYYGRGSLDGFKLVSTDEQYILRSIEYKNAPNRLPMSSMQASQIG